MPIRVIQGRIKAELDEETMRMGSVEAAVTEDKDDTGIASTVNYEKVESEASNQIAEELKVAEEEKVTLEAVEEPVDYVSPATELLSDGEANGFLYEERELLFTEGSQKGEVVALELSDVVEEDPVKESNLVESVDREFEFKDQGSANCTLRNQKEDGLLAHHIHLNNDYAANVLEGKSVALRCSPKDLKPIRFGNTLAPSNYSFCPRALLFACFSK
ncbi:hypothetical protein QQ045_008158 [Rhodiola kirilowii]